MDELVDFYTSLLGEDKIKEMAASLPQEPGKYLVDNEVWILHENGEWEDQTGDRRPVKYNFILVVTGFEAVKVI
jgi:hypothetical protein